MAYNIFKMLILPRGRVRNHINFAVFFVFRPETGPKSKTIKKNSASSQIEFLGLNSSRQAF